jgi:hypothetical protein
LESILGLLKSLKIRALNTKFVGTEKEGEIKGGQGGLRD